MQENKPFIYIGSDHGGFEYKKALVTVLTQKGFEFEDLGAYTYDPTDDYPEYAFAVGHMVSQNQGSFGVLLCKSGAGMCIAANKVKGIRAIDANNLDQAVHAREHNNANVVSVPAENMDENLVIDIIMTFIETKFFEAERHIRRIKKIRDFELEN